MDSKGTQFEKLISQIHKILEPDGSIVKWNEHVTDPDYGGDRQIDILITDPRGNKRYIECRNRTKKDDIMWIESLIGKRISLELESVIAVSSSGFSKGAKIKAKKFDIQLFTINQLNQSEIEQWKPKSICFISIMTIDKLQIQLKPHQVFEKAELNQLIIDNYRKSRIVKNAHLDSFFNTYSANHSEKNEEWTHFKMVLFPPNLQLGRVLMYHIIISANLKVREVEVPVIDSKLYIDQNRSQIEAQIDEFQMGTVLIRSKNKSTLTLRLKNDVLKKNERFTGNIIFGFGGVHTMGEIGFELENDLELDIDIDYNII